MPGFDRGCFTIVKIIQFKGWTSLQQTSTILIYAMVGLVRSLSPCQLPFGYRRILKSIATLRAGAAVIGSGNIDFMIEERTDEKSASYPTPLTGWPPT